MKIPFKRLVVYLALLLSLPFLCIALFYFKEKREWDLVADRIIAIQNLSEMNARKQICNHAVRKAYAEADTFYLDRQVEVLRFLKKEREALGNLLQNPSFTGNEAAEKRYAAIAGEGNRLHFLQGSIQSAEGIQETSEVLTRSVELDAQDLKELLNRIEGNRPGKPQLLITDFELLKKTHPTGNEVFELNLKLLKREFVR